MITFLGNKKCNRNDNGVVQSEYTWAYIETVINSLSNGKTINIVKDQYCNPTWTKSMADIINLFISSNLNGIYHWADADYVNRFELSKKIAEKYELPSKLINE